MFVLTLAFAQPAQAHVGQPRLELSVEKVNPGGALDIRGVEFDYEETISLYLERPGIAIQLGEAVADLDGVFLHSAVLPVDLPEGAYNIRAKTDHHEVVSPALTVQGSPILEEGGGQGVRDEDDPLLAPMPTYAPGVVPGGVSQPVVQPLSQKDPVSSGKWPIFALSILSLFAFFIAFRLRAARTG